jgi:hypothetical protein
MPTAPPAPAGLPRSPAALASVGATIAVADRGGSLLFWPWPAPPGLALAAHGDAGPLAAVGADIASSGGWDPTVTRWDVAAAQPRFTARPFSGRVTALCAQGDDLLVAGADRAPTGGPSRDTVDLLPAVVLRLSPAGAAAPTALRAAGAIAALACGAGWALAIDSDADGLLWLHGDAAGQIALDGGPASALATDGDSALAANERGVWAVDPRNGRATLRIPRDADAPRALAMVAVGEAVFIATSRGVLGWPGDLRLSHAGQPVALASHAGALLVLWEDGTLEQRDPQSGALLRSAAVPRG